jgi:hypothetical protein
MADCCKDKACEIEAIRNRQNATLKIMLGVNAVMFGVELTAGLLALAANVSSAAVCVQHAENFAEVLQV